jgi:hypothetical protein
MQTQMSAAPAGCEVQTIRMLKHAGAQAIARYNGSRHFLSTLK